MPLAPAGRINDDYVYEELAVVTQPRDFGTCFLRVLASIGTAMIVFSTVVTPDVALGQSKSAKAASSSKSAEKPSKGGGDDDSADSDDDSSSDDSDSESTESSSSSKPESTPDVVTPQNISQRLSSILGSAAQNAKWGVLVEVTGSSEPLFKLNADEGLIPASNRKLFTGALALEYLGPEWVFRTYLYQTGRLEADGTLNGNLVIVPSGDPTFSKELFKSATPDWVFRDWAKKVEEAGIKRVTGDLLVDCSNWDMGDMSPRGWADRVMNDSYAPQTSPLTINKNLTNIVLTPGRSGQPANVSFIPAATGYPVVNKTVSGREGASRAKRLENTHIEVTGNVKEKKTIWSLPIDRPTLYAAANFRHHLAENQIPIDGSVRIITAPGSLPNPTTQNVIAMVQSPPLIEIVDYMMKRSDNHMAEQIYVAVSHARLGRGSYSNSLRLEQEMLRRAGIDPSRVKIYDGSGLSEANRVAASDVVKLLNYMSRHQYSKEFYNSLAIAGRDGTLRSRMHDIRGRVHAKTGTIRAVKTLSGYVSLNDGRLVSFSFLVNQHSSNPQGLHDRLCRTLARLVL